MIKINQQIKHNKKQNQIDKFNLIWPNNKQVQWWNNNNEIFYLYNSKFSDKYLLYKIKDTYNYNIKCVKIK